MRSLRTRLGYWLINPLLPAVFPRINLQTLWLLRSAPHPIANLFVITLRHGSASPGRTRAARLDVLVNDLALIKQALRSRRVWRRWLVPVAQQDAVLLRITLGSSGWRRERGRLV